jgi:hypothetical protein
MCKLLNIKKNSLKQFFLIASYTLENRRLGTVIGSMARSFEKESYLTEVSVQLEMILSLIENFR